MDIIYPLGKGSVWYDMEIKYSLRSLSKYLNGYSNIYIIGHQLPPFLDPDKVKFIPHPDTHKNQARNIMEKFLKATEIPELSADFLYMNDDYFFHSRVDIESYRKEMAWKRTLPESIEKNPGNQYQKHLRATLQALQARNLPTLNFDTHSPLVMNKARLSEIIQKYSWDIPFGYTLRSIYCNEVDHPNKIQKPDYKINHPYTSKQWGRMIADLPECFSIGDNAITHGFKIFMLDFLPQKSQFEK